MQLFKPESRYKIWHLNINILLFPPKKESEEFFWRKWWNLELWDRCVWWFSFHVWMII